MKSRKSIYGELGLKLHRKKWDRIDIPSAKKAIIDELDKSPYLHTSELARRVGISIMSCRAILMNMVGEKTIREDRTAGNLVRYYLAKE